MSQSTKFIMTRDINGFNGFGLPFANDNFSATLAANTPASITVPGNFEYWLAIFSYASGATVYVANNHTAASPAGGTFAATTSQLLPSARLVKAADVLSLMTSDTTAEVNVSLYALGNQP